MTCNSGYKLTVDVVEDCLDPSAFSLNKADESDLLDWFPKNIDGDLYKIGIEFKYGFVDELRILLDAAKACFLHQANYILGTMDGEEALYEGGMTEEDLLKWQKEHIWQKKPALKPLQTKRQQAPSVNLATCSATCKNGKQCSRPTSPKSPVDTMCTQHGNMKVVG